jgi:hypothetical protein
MTCSTPGCDRSRLPSCAVCEACLRRLLSAAFGKAAPKS